MFGLYLEQKVSRTSSVPDGKPTAPGRANRAGKGWTYGLVLNTIPGAETEQVTRTTAARTVQVNSAKPS